MAEDIKQLTEYLEDKFDGIDKRFEKIDECFEKVDEKFVNIDKRFDGIDKKFIRIDERFDGIDKRFDNFGKEVGERFNEVDNKFDRLFDVFAAEDDFLEIRKEMMTQNDKHQLLMSIDNYARKADTFYQELVMLSHQHNRHEKWILMLAEKLGVKLEY